MTNGLKRGKAQKSTHMWPQNRVRAYGEIRWLQALHESNVLVISEEMKLRKVRDTYHVNELME